MNDLLRRLLFLPPQASSAARHIDYLHYAVIGATMAGASGVFMLALYFMIRYRRRGLSEVTPRVRMPVILEAALIGGTLALFLLFWVVGYRQYVRLETPPGDAIEVYVTGKQWMWKFAYPNGRQSLGVLTVPLGRPVRLIMTSRDVIHSFFVPAFRLKQDVLPGRYVSLWFTATEPGTWDVFCAEYCGLSHSRMRASVHVVSAADYAQWLDTAEPGDGVAIEASGEHAETRMARYGHEVAIRRGCLACHTVDGQRHIGPSWRGLFGAMVPLADGRSVVADESYLTRSMMDPTVDVVSSFAPVMPTYLGVLEAPEAAALVE